MPIFSIPSSGPSLNHPWTSLVSIETPMALRLLILMVSLSSWSPYKVSQLAMHQIDAMWAVPGGWESEWVMVFSPVLTAYATMVWVFLGGWKWLLVVKGFLMVSRPQLCS